MKYHGPTSLSRPGIGKLWAYGSNMTCTAFVNKALLEHSHSHLLLSVVSTGYNGTVE